MWEFDDTFSSTYNCDLDIELDGNERNRYYFPPGETRGGRDGVTIRVFPRHATDWTGTFAFGRIAPKGMSKVFSTPDANRLLVVSRGEGYMVSADDPSRWERVATIPTMDVRSVGKRDVIVLSSFTDLAAYNEKGLLWIAKRLAWDDLKVISVDDDYIVGEYWNPQTESKQEFKVDLATGVSLVLPEQV